MCHSSLNRGPARETTGVEKGVAGGEEEYQSQRNDGQRPHFQEHLLVHAIVQVDGWSRRLVGVPSRFQEARKCSGRKAPAGAEPRVGRVGPRGRIALNGMMKLRTAHF